MYQINTITLEAKLLNKFKPNLATTYTYRIADTLSRSFAWVRITPEEASRALTSYWLEGEHVYDTPMGKYKSKRILNGSVMFFKRYESDGRLPVKGWPGRVVHFLKKDYPLTDDECSFIINAIDETINEELHQYQFTDISTPPPAEYIPSPWYGYGVQ